MKANAKKLLALIMAMVMCLSLAAPAMAAGSNALSTQASLSTQAAVATVTNIYQKSTTDTDLDEDQILVTTNADPAGTKYTLGKDSYPAWIEVSKTSAAHVGDWVGKATYVITVATSKGYEDAVGRPIKVEVAGEKNNTVEVEDVAKWTKLEGADTQFGMHEVMGSYWKELQDNGKYRVFFKLNTVENKAFKTGADDWKYLVADNQSGSDSLSDSLSVAVTCNAKGQSTGDAIANASVTIDGKTVDKTKTEYTYKAINAVDVEIDDAAATVKFLEDKDTGTFQVSVYAKEWKLDGRGDKTEVVKEGYLTSASEVEKLVKEKLDGKCTVVSVTAASGNYFDVTVKKGVESEEFATATNLHHKNAIYWVKNGKQVAGLYNIAEKGYYNGKDEKGSNGVQIEAGTELLGPVAVKLSDVSKFTHPNAKQEGDYLVYDDVKTMEKDIKATNCKDSKTVSYVQLVVNKKNDTKLNRFVSVNDVVFDKDVAGGAGNYAVTVTGSWFLPDNVKENKDFVKTGSWTVAATEHQNKKVTTEITKKPTCQDEGIEVTKTVCTDCGNVVESSEKVLPKVSDPIEINKFQIQDPAYPNDTTKKIDKVYFDDEDKNAKRGPKTEHYVAKREVKTSVGASATETIKTTTYTCSYGYVHDELTKVETIKKADLQGAGKWNLITWGTDYSILPAGQAYAPDAWAGNLYGNTVEIADSDIEDETLPLNRTTPKDKVFKFNSAKSMDDGTYAAVATATDVGIYASASALPKQKSYDAVLTIKNIVNAKFHCLEGSATIEVKVYERTNKFGSTDSITDNYGKFVAKNLEDYLKDGKMTLVQTFSKDVVIPATAAHKYSAGADVCDVCSTSRTTVASQLFTADTITVSDLTYTGKAALPKVVVKDTAGNLLIKDIDYQIGYEDENATAVGEYFVVIKGIGDYAGNRISKTYKIVAAATAAKKQTLKVSVAKKTFKVKNLKKKKASFTTKLSGAKTAVTWKSSNAKVTVKGSKKKATITVKKGTKKGTYKVTATAKKTSAYKKGTVTIKVIVK